MMPLQRIVFQACNTFFFSRSYWNISRLTFNAVIKYRHIDFIYSVTYLKRAFDNETTCCVSFSMNKILYFYSVWQASHVEYIQQIFLVALGLGWFGLNTILTFGNKRYLFMSNSQCWKCICYEEKSDLKILTKKHFCPKGNKTKRRKTRH